MERVKGGGGRGGGSERQRATESERQRATESERQRATVVPLGRAAGKSKDATRLRKALAPSELSGFRARQGCFRSALPGISYEFYIVYYFLLLFVTFWEVLVNYIVFCFLRFLMLFFYVFIGFQVFMGVQRCTWRRSREMKRSTPRKPEELAFPLEGP